MLLINAHPDERRELPARIRRVRLAVGSVVRGLARFRLVPDRGEVVVISLEQFRAERERRNGGAA